MYFYSMLAIVYHALSMLGPDLSKKPEPRLEFQPMLVKHSTESPLIMYRHDNISSYKPWVDLLQTALEPYEQNNQFSENVVMCNFENPPHPGKVCYFDTRAFGTNCTKEQKFGYDKGRPCVMLKMNQVEGWVPEPYSSNQLPSDMPVDLKEVIQRFYRGKPMVWLSCDGESPADRENMGPIVYTPNRGFPAYFFPYMHDEGYLSPIIMMEFLKPKPGALINIECKMWLKNIDNNSSESRGRMHFELLIE